MSEQLGTCLCGYGNHHAPHARNQSCGKTWKPWQPVPAPAESALKGFNMYSAPPKMCPKCRHESHIGGCLAIEGMNNATLLGDCLNARVCDCVPDDRAEYTCPRCDSNVSTHICMGEPVAGETDEPDLCSSTHEGYVCTNYQGHAGDHLTQGMPGKILHRWPNPAPSVAVPEGEANNQKWRVGRTVGRTLYIGDRFIGSVDTRELASQIVEAVNAGGVSTAGMTAETFYERWRVSGSEDRAKFARFGAWHFKYAQDFAAHVLAEKGKR